MDINLRLKERRVKINLEKKHMKAKLYKQLKKETVGDSDFLDKVNKLKEKDLIINKDENQSASIQTPAFSSTEGKEKHTDKERNHKPEKNNNFNKSSNFKANANTNFSKDKNANIANTKAPFNREEYERKRKQQYKRLTKTNHKGQPIMKNKIEHLFKKIKNMKK